MEAEDSVLPEGESVVAAVRKTWHEATMPPCVMEKDWYRLMKEKSVSPTLIFSDPQWPLLPRPKAVEQNGEEEQGENFLNSILQVHCGNGN